MIDLLLALALPDWVTTLIVAVVGGILTGVVLAVVGFFSQRAQNVDTWRREHLHKAASDLLAVAREAQRNYPTLIAVRQRYIDTPNNSNKELDATVESRFLEIMDSFDSAVARVEILSGDNTRLLLLQWRLDASGFRIYSMFDEESASPRFTSDPSTTREGFKDRLLEFADVLPNELGLLHPIRDRYLKPLRHPVNAIRRLLASMRSHRRES